MANIRTLADVNQAPIPSFNQNQSPQRYQPVGEPSQGDSNVHSPRGAPVLPQQLPRSNPYGRTYQQGNGE